MKDISDKIEEIIQKKNLEIIGFYSLPGESQKVCSAVGGFLKLYKFCKNSDKRVFLYCGPDFIANLIYIALPTKIIFKLKDRTECNLNDYMTSIEIKELMQMFPLAKVAAYYKSKIKILASADCVFDDTSNNLIDCINGIDAKQIIVSPDYNIGYYAKTNCPEKEIIVPHGFCPPLYGVTSDNIQIVKLKHPESKIIMHPETNYHLHKFADLIMGYDQAYEYFFKSPDKSSYILVYNHFFSFKLRYDFPNLNFYKPDVNLKCPEVKDISPELILDALDNLQFNVEIPEEYRIIIEKKLKKFILTN